VNDLGHRVTSILNMDELATTLVGLVRDKFGYRYVHLFINDLQRGETVLLAGAGADSPQLAPRRFAIPFGRGIVGWVAANGKSLLANDVTREPQFLYHPAVGDTRAELAVPLIVGGRGIGVLDAQSERFGAFEPSDVATLETLAGQVAIAIDNARLYGEVQEQARRDSLTQVYNHGYFIERLREEMERAQRESKPLSLIMLDVDNFKEYNDRYGHVIGDQVLSLLVQAIHAHVKRTDLVGRWGGEEFGIALLETDAADARQVAQRIRQTLAETHLPQKDGKPILPPTASQGIASCPKHAQDTDALIDLADRALYQAKTRGRDQIKTAEEK
jgi:diguanylate cyclase (GGDEF)-like protein